MEKLFGNFNFIETPISDLYVIEARTFGDKRGYFKETYKKDDFNKAGLGFNFIQDNESKSKKGVLRGLHYQKEFPQTKLVRVIHGEVFDVAVDLRKDSPTYGKYFGVVLSGDKGNQFLIPKGFAHGFYVLSETAVFVYKVDEIYHPEDEGGFIWNDPDVGIEWPLGGDVLLSEKDQRLPRFKEIKVNFNL